MLPNWTAVRSTACFPGITTASCCSRIFRWKLTERPARPAALYALVAYPPNGGRAPDGAWPVCNGVGFPGALRGSMVLATVLAAVALAGGPEISKTCSKFVSVSSSLDGVISVGGSKNVSGIGGVPGISGPVTSACIRGGNAAMSTSGTTGAGAMDASTIAS